MIKNIFIGVCLLMNCPDLRAMPEINNLVQQSETNKQLYALRKKLKPYLWNIVLEYSNFESESSEHYKTLVTSEAPFSFLSGQYTYYPAHLLYFVGDTLKLRVESPMHTEFGGFIIWKNIHSGEQCAVDALASNYSQRYQNSGNSKKCEQRECRAWSNDGIYRAQIKSGSTFDSVTKITKHSVDITINKGALLHSILGCKLAQIIKPLERKVPQNLVPDLWNIVIEYLGQDIVLHKTLQAPQETMYGYACISRRNSIIGGANSCWQHVRI